MSIIREDQFANFLSGSTVTNNGILIYGDDSSGAELLVRRLVTRIGGVGSSPVRLTSSAVSADPALLDEHIRSLSLLGGRSVICITDAGEDFLRYVKAFITTEMPGNFLAILSGSLTKASKLRKECEVASHFAALALYEPKPDVLRSACIAKLSESGLRFGEGADARFFDLVGLDRSVSLQECEKLSLYAGGQSEISVSDVEAVCGDVTTVDTDQLLQYLMQGDILRTDQLVGALELTSLRTVLVLLPMQLDRLRSMKFDVAGGMSIESAIAAAKPMIFYQHRRSVADQLRGLTVADIDELEALATAVTKTSRKNAELAYPLISRALLSMARLVQHRMNN